MTSAIFETGAVEIELKRVMAKLSSAPLAALLGGVVHPHLQRSTAGHFSDNGSTSPTGRWEPLRESTINFRADQGYGPTPINRRTDGMYDALTRGQPTVAGAGIAGAILLFPGNSIMKGLLKDKYLTAQQGLDKPHTPARPVVYLDGTDYAWMLRTVQTYVET